MKLLLNRFTVVVSAIATISGLAGCAGMDASNQKADLVAAGFKKVKPTTSKQKEFYASAEPYKVLRRATGGNVFYVYKDEKQHLAYVGGKPEFERYQRLALQQDYMNLSLLGMQLGRY